MAKKHEKHEEEFHADETWLVPYSDVLTLLLALFIVLFAMSKIDQEKFEQLAESLQTAFGGGAAGILTGESIISPIAPQRQQNQQEQPGRMDQTEMNAVLNAFIEANELQNLVSVFPTSSGFSVRIIDSLVFSSGSTQILPEAYPILDKISEMAYVSPYYINIEGHTDDLPVRNGSNWELSTDRAMAVLRYLVGRGVQPRKLSATGYGEYHPILPNITEENRSRNRRVEINFIDPEFFEHNIMN